MSKGPSFADLVASGDPEAMEIHELMQSEHYTSMNGSEHSKAYRQVISDYFRKRFGTGPASGMRQKNTVSRGSLRG